MMHTTHYTTQTYLKCNKKRYKYSVARERFAPSGRSLIKCKQQNAWEEMVEILPNLHT
jgi:hypothetical protein